MKTDGQQQQQSTLKHEPFVSCSNECEYIQLQLQLQLRVKQRQSVASCVTTMYSVVVIVATAALRWSKTVKNWRLLFGGCKLA